MRFRYLRLGAATIVGISLAACGVINDATSIKLELPDKKFTISADAWQVAQPAADSFLAMPCDTATMACSTLADTLCEANCSGACNAANTCDLSLDISLAQPVNLVTDQPALKTFSDQSTIRISVDSVTFDVRTNDLTVDTPVLTVYVAPMSVTLSSDPMAIEIGTVATVPAGQLTAGPEPIDLSEAGRAALVKIMSSFKTPFNVLVGASIHLTEGELVPSGKLDAIVQITGYAGV